MSLQPVQNTPGLWREPNWTPGTPGVYAIIIGISAYPHLTGGTDPAKETHRLKQLVSSASTAAGLFMWLRDSFKREGLPVVWCQLLLSPTASERAGLECDGLTHYATPDYATLRTAIQRWTGNVPSTEPAARASRTLFFFSGHGVQANRRSLLLPSDYLDPSLGAPQYENCISALELWRWMEEHPVAEHLALIDACRNEFPPLAGKGASAHTLFPVNPPDGPPPRTAACLSSTSPNAVAFQLPERPLTVFGQALLEALAGRADAVHEDRIDFLQLQGYVTPRVNELLREAKRSAVNQTTEHKLVVCGDDGSLIVTELPDVPLSYGLQPRSTRSATGHVTAALESRFDPALAVSEPIPVAALAASQAQAQRRFGHEHASMLWLGGVYFLSLHDGHRLTDEESPQIVRVERNPESTLVQVDLELGGSSHGVLAVFEGAGNVEQERLAIPLPTDYEKVPVRLTLTIESSAPNEWPRLRHIDARLGPSHDNRHYDYLWQLTREADLGSLATAARRASPERLRDTVKDKLTYPTAAIAGALLLARAGSIAVVQDWPRNLMEWFPAFPDGAVLWAEALRDAVMRGQTAPYGVTDPTGEMASALASLLVRGVPLFADTVELAQSLARRLLRARLDDPRRTAVAQVAAMLERATQVSFPGGHFLLLAGRPRPTELPGDGALSAEDLRRIVRPHHPGALS